MSTVHTLVTTTVKTNMDLDSDEITVEAEIEPSEAIGNDAAVEFALVSLAKVLRDSGYTVEAPS